MTRLDRARGETAHRFPDILPDGGATLFTIVSLIDGAYVAQVAVRDLRTGTQKVLVRGGSDARYVSSGHLVYTADGALRAVPFDVRRLEVRGTSMAVVPRLMISDPYVEGAYAAAFAVAPDGTLVYVDPPAGASNTTLGTRIISTPVWVDRAGREQPIPAPARPYLYPRLSPDGTRLAVTSADQENDIWILDLTRATPTRLTTDPASTRHPSGRPMANAWSSTRIARGCSTSGGRPRTAARLPNA